jgi:positive regulator of sigma E activity
MEPVLELLLPYLSLLLMVMGMVLDFLLIMNYQKKLKRRKKRRRIK